MLTTMPPTAEICDSDPTLGHFRVELFTDNHPVETTLLLVNSASGEKVLSGPKEGDSYEDDGSYHYEACLPLGPYMLTSYDTDGDAICCQYGEGNYMLTVIDTEIQHSGAFG